jgi:hypothetical protein
LPRKSAWEFAVVKRETTLAARMATVTSTMIRERLDTGVGRRLDSSGDRGR